MKRLLLAVVDFLRFQIEHDKCTIEEMKSIYEAISEHVEIDATNKDIAEFFGKSEQSVRGVCSRKYGDKPKRRIYHNFGWFVKNAPKKWFE